MGDDPLTRFTSMLRPKSRAVPESQPPSRPAVDPPAPENTREAYEAFDAKDRAHAHGLDIRCSSRGGALSYVIMYSHLHIMAYDRRTWTRILITVSGLAIEIRGRNLRGLVEAIRMRTCEVVQEYSEQEHVLPQPADLNAAFIERISVEVIGGQDARDKAHGE